jgi:alkylation response protein AidB-like acyl-CoA dehydrogenase
MLNSIAKAKANKVYHQVCYHCMVIHGAIGWTEEMDIGLYHLRTKALEFDGGGTDFHKEKIAVELEKHEPAFMAL